VPPDELGSIPEKQEGRLYNTSTVFSPTGKLIAKHRKVFCCPFVFRCHFLFFVVVAHKKPKTNEFATIKLYQMSSFSTHYDFALLLYESIWGQAAGYQPHPQAGG